MTQASRFIDGFVVQLHEKLPELTEEQATLATVCAIGAALVELLQIRQAEATEAFGLEIAQTIKASVYRAYHPGVPFHLATDVTFSKQSARIKSN